MAPKHQNQVPIGIHLSHSERHGSCLALHCTRHKQRPRTMNDFTISRKKTGVSQLTDEGAYYSFSIVLGSGVLSSYFYYSSNAEC